MLTPDWGGWGGLGQGQLQGRAAYTPLPTSLRQPWLSPETQADSLQTAVVWDASGCWKRNGLGTGDGEGQQGDISCGCQTCWEWGRFLPPSTLSWPELLSLRRQDRTTSPHPVCRGGVPQAAGCPRPCRTSAFGRVLSLWTREPEAHFTSAPF